MVETVLTTGYCDGNVIEYFTEYSSHDCVADISYPDIS